LCNGSGTESAADPNDLRSTQGYKDKKVSKMKVEEIRVRDRIRMRGLKNKGLIEISQDPKTGDFVLIMGKGIHKRCLIFNFPEGMWRATCPKEQVLDVVKDFLTEKILKD
jgi:hypothetical protein